MADRALVLVRHGTPVAEEVDAARPLSDEGKAEAAFVADGLCAYLELPSNFMPRADGEPRPVTIIHSGKDRAAQTASVIKEALAKAGCDTTCTADKDALAPNAATEAALSLVASSSTPITILVGHLPHLHNFATALGAAIAADAFGPCGGVLFEASGGDGKWSLAHHIQPMSAKKDWWRHGVSVHVRADAADDDVDVEAQGVA